MPSGVYVRTAEQKINISNGVKKSWQEPKYRKTQDEANKRLNVIRKRSKAQTGRIISNEHRRKISIARKGKKFSKKWCRNISIAASKRNNDNMYSYGVIAKYRNTCIIMKSDMERDFAELLDKNNIKWEYESYYFIMKNGRCYTPDFYLPDANIFIEVKPKRKIKNNNVQYKYNQVKEQGDNIWFAHEKNPKKTVKHILKLAS